VGVGWEPAGHAGGEWVGLGVGGWESVGGSRPGAGGREGECRAAGGRRAEGERQRGGGGGGGKGEQREDGMHEPSGVCVCSAEGQRSVGSRGAGAGGRGEGRGAVQLAARGGNMRQHVAVRGLACGKQEGACSGALAGSKKVAKLQHQGFPGDPSTQY
jgi:hypothetical protein